MDSFSVIPAIDVLEGRCVRLSEGRRERVTVEGGDPAAAAARFVADGARYLHLVDLDGAFSGLPSPGLVERVVAAAGGVPVQAGGGLRSAAAVESALAAGAAGDEPGGRRRGIPSLEHDTLATALREPYTPSLEDVDRGDDREAAHAVVLTC